MKTFVLPNLMIEMVYWTKLLQGSNLSEIGDNLRHWIEAMILVSQDTYKELNGVHTMNTTHNPVAPPDIHSPKIILQSPLVGFLSEQVGAHQICAAPRFSVSSSPP